MLNFVVVRAAAITVVLVLFRTGTPDENHGHTQNNDDWKKLLPIHAGNIAANRPRANGIFMAIIFTEVLKNAFSKKAN
jgi:hypothetical protein